jgi:hypothetical protein
MFETYDLRHISAKLKIFIIVINYYICSIFHAENNLLKLQFNFTHFIRPILTLCGPTSLYLFWLTFILPVRVASHRTMNFKSM